MLLGKLVQLFEFAHVRSDDSSVVSQAKTKSNQQLVANAFGSSHRLLFYLNSNDSGHTTKMNISKF